MKYENIFPGVFLSRPNRFIAHIEIDGTDTVCHVKNTGRCRELLIPGVPVWVQQSDNPRRKTAYDLIAVQKGSRIINMDSQIPNKVFAEFAKENFPDLRLIKSEQQFEDSRLDFYLETGQTRIFAEVKGVTLEENGVARFPDAPTERGIKHIRALMRCVDAGFDAWVVFLIQMDGIRHFTPNDDTHKAFGDALRAASQAGVRILALECDVTPDHIVAVREVPVIL